MDKEKPVASKFGPSHGLRTREAPPYDAQIDRRFRAARRRRGPGYQLDFRRRGRRRSLGTDAADRSAQDTRGNLIVREPDTWQCQPRASRRRHLVTDGYLDPAA